LGLKCFVKRQSTRLGPARVLARKNPLHNTPEAAGAALPLKPLAAQGGLFVKEEAGLKARYAARTGWVC